MRGVSFQNGVEFKISIEGESWSQGDRITGKIESKPIAPAFLYLAEGNDKKVKAKSADAFVVLEEWPSATAPFDWKFELPLDARISDKSGSLYLLYGKTENLETLGFLRLPINPHQHVKDLIDLMTAEFRFALKSVNHHKSGSVEIKLEPSGTKDWASLEALYLFVKLNEKILEVKFQFHRNEIDALKGGVATKIVKREFNRQWETSKIVHDFNQRLNKDVAKVEVERVIAEYRKMGWLSS